MKTYFNNFPYTAESLKSEYRELCKKLHPDTGGSEEEFKAMAAEYEQISYNVDANNRRRQREQEEAEQRRQEEEARRQREEEERRQREEEERRERERKAKARPLYDARCKKWAHLMEDLRPYMDAERQAYTAHGWRSNEYKAAERATNAARRRNLLKMAQHTFKGVKFSLKYDNGWGGGYTISWTDGPSLKEFNEKTDYNLFVSGWDTFDGMTDCAGFEKADFTEFADKFSGKSGEIERERIISDDNRRKMADVLKRLSGDFTDEKARERFNLRDWEDNKAFLNADKLREFFQIFGHDFDTVKDHDLEYYAMSSHDLAAWINKLSEYINLKTDEEKKQEKPAEFVPQYGPTLRTLFKLAGGRDAAFWLWDDKSREITPITLNDIVDHLLKGDRVRYGKRHQYSDGEGNKKNVSYWGVNNGGYKTQAARAAKWGAAGYIIEGSGHSSTYKDVEICGITPDTAYALRAELADIERLRKAWEAGQTADKATEKATRRTKGTKTGNNTTDTANDAQKATNEAAGVDMDAAPADGLGLVEIAGGVAVVGDSRTTFKNRKAIKARGARWNRDAQQWQATDPEAVAALRAWFGMDADTANDDQTATANDAAESAQDAPQGNESTADGQTPTDTPDDAAQAAETPQDDAAPHYDTCEISPILEAFANLFRVIVDTMEEAKKYEGVTVPADTLTRWKTEAETGAKSTAAQLAEVCACLGSLTPDNRKEFDALGVIFWTLSEQLRQGFNPDTIAPATDYARGQLFDLISRTQHPNQAQAVRDATHRAAA